MFQGKKEGREGGRKEMREGRRKKEVNRRKGRKEGRIHIVYGFNLRTYIKKSYFTHILQIKVIILLLWSTV